MAGSFLGIETYGGWENIEDYRWMINRTSFKHGQNANLVIDAAAQAEGGHRHNQYLKSGVPVYKDTETNTVKVWSTEAKEAGEKIFGLTSHIVQVQDVHGEFYENVPMGVFTAGEIKPEWLPVEVDPADLSDRFALHVG